MIRYRAASIVPVSEAPIRDAWVGIDRGRIVAIGRGAGDRDLGDVALMPGLVNAHTHFELSYLHNRLPPADRFVTWIRGIIEARRVRDPNAEEIATAMTRAIDHAIACGTAVVGDISNTLVSVAPVAHTPLAGVIFNEVIRFRADGAAAVVADALCALQTKPFTTDVRPALAAHAPYSVSPALFSEIRRAVDGDPRARCSVHLAEGVEETEFVRDGGGPWRTMLEQIGSWDPAWSAPGVSSVEYLDRCGFFNDRVLAVHGVQMSAADLARLRSRGTTLVTCPRSNRLTGAGTPPIEAFYSSGVRVAIGTDSLASTPDLNVFAEMAELRRLAPSVPAAAIVDSATRQGARALGFDRDFGSLEPGKRARLIAVQIPPDTTDVEEYLVTGITQERIKWLEE